VGEGDLLAGDGVGCFIFGHGGSVGGKVEGGAQGFPPCGGRKAIKNPAAAG
jgi:hypothetical protein